MVLRGDAPQALRQLVLGERLPAQGLVLSHPGGDRLGDQLVERVHADGLEHPLHLGGAGADVTAVREVVRVVVNPLPGPRHAPMSAA